MVKRFCIILDDDVNKLLRLYQAKYIKKNQDSCSFSKALNLVLKNYFYKK